MRSLLLFLVCVLSASAFSQEDPDRLPASFHAGRRQALRNLMPARSMAILFAAPEHRRANDTKYKYHQDPDFYYLTGITEPGAVLFLFSEPEMFSDSLVTTELLFVRDRDAAKEAWTGRILGTAGARKLTGIPAFSVSVLEDFPLKAGSCKGGVFLQKDRDDVADEPGRNTDLFDLMQQVTQRIQLVASPDRHQLREWLAQLREVKQPAELLLLRKAIDITCEAHAAVMRNIQSGMHEYEAQAIEEFIFTRSGSEHPGFPTIAGSAENSCILHYETNRRKMTGNLLVLDAGAEYHGYTADVTRTFPVNGKFSAEERIIYDIVLEAQEAGIRACVAGSEFRASHKAAQAVIAKRLLELGIIRTEDEFLRYFFHGTSHYLGLDVHDAGTYGKLKVNTVITVEPGIYIPANSPCDPKWWNIGVRIEDDILVTERGPENLSGALPRSAQEIERIMAEEGEPGLRRKNGR